MIIRFYGSVVASGDENHVDTLFPSTLNSAFAGRENIALAV